MHVAPPHPHKTIGEAGQCPECRLHNIGVIGEAPTAFVLRFMDEDTGARSVAVVRCWGDDPAMAAWATGCNPGGRVGWTDVPLEVIEASGVPLFTLIEEPAATAAVDALMAAGRDRGDPE